MAAHAIGEGARALSEGTIYEPKPLILHWAGSSQEILQIGGCLAPEGRGEAPVYRQGQAGTETNTSSVRHPLLARALTFPKVQAFPSDQVTNQKGPKCHGERSRSPRQKTKPNVATEPIAQTEGSQSGPPKTKDPSSGSKAGKAKAIFAKVPPKLAGLLYFPPVHLLGGNFLPDGHAAVGTNTGHASPFHKDHTWGIQDQFSQESWPYPQSQSCFSRRQSHWARPALVQSSTQQRMKKDRLITYWISERWTKRERERERETEKFRTAEANATRKRNLFFVK